MSENLKNKIEAKSKNISSLLKDQKFSIDYYQREYRWQEEHIQLLIEDLTSTFLKSYERTHKRSEVANYQNYYIGPVVFSIKDGKKSIIDGQQRITSITLFLIYLNHLQEANGEQEVSISELIFSEKYGEKSFNMTDTTREPCLKALFEKGKYKTRKKDETVKNMHARYEDIEEIFPEELAKEALPYFIDWLIKNVILVEIIAHSDENAFTIFKTMNDRGLDVTPTEMLKGYILSKITNDRKRLEINNIWKKQIQKLHKYEDTADLSFFQAWFRGKYASIQSDEENKDFELIETKFHNWFKDNHEKVFQLKTSDEFYGFFKNQFPFFVKWYLESWDAQNKYRIQKPHLYFLCDGGIDCSLQDALLLSSINYGDKESIINKKLDFVARFIETFTVRRTINYRSVGQTSIKYTMFNIIKLIRNNDIKELGENLTKETNKIEEKWDGIWDFGLHGQNRKFVKHLLSRITSYIDKLVGKSTTYETYARHPEYDTQYEIEHIWGNKFEEHKDEFKQENEFQEWRNSIGALILLPPNGINQSLGVKKYEDKLKQYLKENAFAQTLHPAYYEKNPDFLKVVKIQELKFKGHKEFKKGDIEERLKLVQRICEQIWSVDYYKKNRRIKPACNNVYKNAEIVVKSSLFWLTNCFS